MAKKFNQIWTNQTELGEQFGLSAINIGKILIEHGLKDPQSNQATSRAIQEGFAKSTPLKNGTSFFMWHRQKVKGLISQKHVSLNAVDFWVHKVRNCILEANKLWEEGQDKMASLIMDCAYEEVPKNIRKEVEAKVETLTI
jgi:hypothetical protein